MLPITPSIFVVDGASLLWRLRPREYGSWDLIGTGDVGRFNCGFATYRGCLNVWGHDEGKHFKTFEPSLKTSSVPTSNGGKVFVHVGHKSCGKPSCPTCKKAYMSKEAKRIADRFSHYYTKQLAIHFIASVPRSKWFLPKAVLQKECNKLAKETHFQGGCSIYHPFRKACLICGCNIEPEDNRCSNCGASQFGWKYAPHFHMIGYGWIEETKEIYERTGWIFKNLGVRDSVFWTAWYQLSHCGVWYGAGHRHTVTWFGSMTYAKLKIPVEKRKDLSCPYCGGDTANLAYDGGLELCDVDGDYLLDAEGWRQKGGRRYAAGGG
jgi:uncharacterized Zn-finger protein